MEKSGWQFSPMPLLANGFRIVSTLQAVMHSAFR
tara:strand:- start:1712 stop:1813 length:102 start_codon:yes stop_codon:yes gene_type:complete